MKCLEVYLYTVCLCSYVPGSWFIGGVLCRYSAWWSLAVCSRSWVFWAIAVRGFNSTYTSHTRALESGGERGGGWRGRQRAGWWGRILALGKVLRNDMLQDREKKWGQWQRSDVTKHQEYECDLLKYGQRGSWCGVFSGRDHNCLLVRRGAVEVQKVLNLLTVWTG